MLQIDNIKELKQNRLIPKAKKRKVYLSDSFQCSPNLVDGWETFKQVVEKGGDLKPYLSRGVKNLKSDYMLYSWGIYHFHLGLKIEKDGFTERTKYVLIAFINEDSFYVIGIYNHQSDAKVLPWDNTEIVEILHRNWSYLISDFQIVGVLSAFLSPEARKSLRKMNGNTTISVSNGTVYSMVGGGIMPNGENILDVMRMDYENRKATLFKEQT